MPLIKANQAPAALAAFSMKSIEEQARAILLRAKQQADALIAEARLEAECLKQRAADEGAETGRQEGFACGLRQGKQAGHEQALSEHRAAFSKALSTLTEAAGRIDQSRQQLEAQALTEVVELAIAIARRITCRQGELDPRILEQNLCEAMKLVVHAADVRIAIHPAQKSTLADALPRLQLQWPQLRHVEMIEDPELTPGGCRIFTVHGSVDADLNAQLDRIVADLLPQEQSTA
jgi:flagellar biosynthesis/type III secretory pathway protein FliH